MNKDKIERFDTAYFNKLSKEDKEEYFLQYIRKTLGIMERGGNRNGN